MKLYNFYPNSFQVSVFDSSGNSQSVNVKKFSTSNINLSGTLYIHVTSLVAMNGYDTGYHEELNQRFINDGSDVILLFNPDMYSRLKNQINNGGNNYKLLEASDSNFELPVRDTTAIATITKSSNPSFYNGVYLLPVNIPFDATKYQRVSTTYVLSNTAEITSSDVTAQVTTVDDPYYKVFSPSQRSFLMINATDIAVQSNVSMSPSTYYQSTNNNCTTITADTFSTSSILFEYDESSSGYEPPCWTRSAKFPLVTIFAKSTEELSDFQGFYPNRVNKDFQLYVNGDWYLVNSSTPGLYDFFNSPYYSVRIILIPGSVPEGNKASGFSFQEYYLSDPQSGNLVVNQVSYYSQATQQNTFLIAMIILIVLAAAVLAIVFVYYYIKDREQ